MADRSKITIEVGIQPLSNDAIKVAEKLQNLISKSNASANDKKSAQKQLDIVEKYTRSINSILAKPKINRNDITNLQNFEVVLRSALKDLEKTASRASGIASQEMLRLQEQINQAAADSEKKVGTIKAQFAGALKGKAPAEVTFDNMNDQLAKFQETVDRTKKELAKDLQTVESRELIDLTLANAQAKIDLSNAQQLESQKREIVEKSYGIDLSQYKDTAEAKRKIEVDLINYLNQYKNKTERENLAKTRTATEMQKAENEARKAIPKIEKYKTEATRNRKAEEVLPGVGSFENLKKILDKSSDAYKNYEKNVLATQRALVAEQNTQKGDQEKEYQKRIDALKELENAEKAIANIKIKSDSQIKTEAKAAAETDKEIVKKKNLIATTQGYINVVTQEGLITQNALNAERQALNGVTQGLKTKYDAEEQTVKSDYNNKLKEATDALKNNEKGLDSFKFALKRASDEEAKANLKAQVYGKTLDGLINKIKMVTGVLYLLRKAWQKIQEGKNIVAGLDKEMMEIGIVTKQTTEELWKNFDTFNRVASQLATTTKQYLEGAKIFYQQGMKTAEVMEMVEATTKAAALGGVDLRTASETLTASIRAYNMEATQAMDVTDKFAAVGAFSAADFRELSLSMEKVASSAYSAGMSFDYTLGILAKGIETTREAPEAIGTALKTIIARFQEMKENPMAQLEDGVDANRIEKALKSIGVSLRDTNGEFRDLDGVFTDLGERWGGLTRNQKAYIATMAAGMRQQSRFMAIMNNYERTLQLVRMSTNSAGEANAQYEVYLDSVGASQQRLEASMEKFYASLTNSELIKTVYDSLTGITNFFNSMGPPVVLISGLIGVLTAKILSLIVATKLQAGADLFAATAGKKFVHSYVKKIGKLMTGKTIVDANTYAIHQQTLAELQQKIALESTNPAIFAQNAATSNLTVEEYKNTLATQINSEEQYLNANAKAQNAVATKILTFSMIGLTLAITAGVLAFTAISNAIKENRLQKQKETIATKKEAREARTNLNTLKGQINRYEELSKTLNKTNEEKEEMLTLANDISATNPELIKSLDEEGNAILKNTDLLKDYILEQERNIKKLNEVAIASQAATAALVEFGATVEEGAIGQGTADLGARIQDQIKSYSNFWTATADSFLGKPALQGLAQSFNNIVQNNLELTDENIREQFRLNLGPYGSGYTEEQIDEYFSAVQDEYNLMYSLIEKYRIVRLSETTKSFTELFRSNTESEINILEQSGVELTNAYKSIFSSLSLFAVEEAKNNAIDINNDGIISILEETEAISKQAPIIFDNMKNELLKARNQIGFEEVLESIFDLKENQGTFNEINQAIEDLANRFNLSSALVDSLKNQISDKSFIEDQIATLISIVGNSVGNQFKTTLENSTPDLNVFLLSSINNIETDALKTMYTKALNNIFAESGKLEEFEFKFGQLNPNDYLQVEQFKKWLDIELAKTIKDSGIRGLIIDEIMDTSQFTTDSFLSKLKPIYEEIDKINQYAEKSRAGTMTTEDMFGAAERFGIGSIIIKDNQYLIDQMSIIQQKRVEEEKILNNVNGIIINLEKEQENLVESSGLLAGQENERNKELIKANSIAIEAKESEIKKYEELIEKIKEAQNVELERAQTIENLNILQGSVKEIDSLIKLMSEFKEGKMSPADILLAGFDNPELLSAIEFTADGVKMNIDAIQNLIAAKKQDALVTLQGEKRELEAQIAIIEGNKGVTKEVVAGTASQAEMAAISALEQLKANKKEIQGQIALAKSVSQTTQLYLEQVNLMRKSRGESALGPTNNFNLNYLQGELNYVNNQIATAEANLSKIKNESLMQSLFETTGTGNTTELLKFLNNQLSDTTNMIEFWDNVDPYTFFEELGDGAKSASDSFEAFNGELEKFFNILRKIENIQSEIEILQGKIDLGSTDFSEDIDLLEEQSDLLQGLINGYTILVEKRKEDLKIQRNMMTAQFGAYVSFDDAGQIKVDETAINQMKITNESQELYYDSLKEAIENYVDSFNELASSETDLTQALADQEQLYNDLNDKIIETRQAMYDALLEADNREVELAEEKFDKLTELEDKYLEAVKNAIDEERSLRDKSNSEEELALKKRKLATLERDTSGMYSKQVASLRAEIQESEQDLRDKEIDRQYELLQKQYEVQQEQRDLQIQFLEEQIRFREESGYYWERINFAIAAGPEAMASILTSTSEFAMMDPLAQKLKSEEIAYSVGELYRIYQEGLATAPTNASIDSIISEGVNNIVNKLSTIEIPDYTPVVNAIDNLQVKLNTSGSGSSSGYSGGTSTSTSSSLVPMEFAMAKQIYQNKTGMTKEQIKALQMMLNKDLNINLTIDGSFGPATQAAFKTWYNKRYSAGGGGGVSFGEAYSTGGLADYTGPAWVHGTPSEPEAFLNARQTEIFASLRDFFDSYQNMSTTPRNLNSSNVTMGDIVINLANKTNATGDEIAKLVRKEILNSFQSRTTTMVQRIR